MSCSHLKDDSFILEPDLSFMDTAFSDVIYFINARSTGFNWTVRQFQVRLYFHRTHTHNLDSGHLKAMDRLTIKHPRKGVCLKCLPILGVLIHYISVVSFTDHRI
ncbi:unnamed protein product [Anisakis simplex]|uniref:CACTA en-spm transposon protein n=1 Tax=Anisakis simplex TaxID=6269 RepID=A0A0M3JDN3_ANISI|nr:unnamed protein product [Anisakis simplex]